MVNVLESYDYCNSVSVPRWMVSNCQLSEKMGETTESEKWAQFE